MKSSGESKGWGQGRGQDQPPTKLMTIFKDLYAHACHVCVICLVSLIIMYTAVQPLRKGCRKFSEIRATRRLLWHSDFTKFNFDRPAGEFTMLLSPFSWLGRGIPLPIPHPINAFGVSFSTPSASRRGTPSVPKAPINEH